MSLERLFSYLDVDDRASRTAKIRAFQLTFLAAVGCEGWFTALRQWSDLDAQTGFGLFAITGSCAAALVPRWRRAAFACLALFLLWRIWASFPWAGNHRYLQLLLAALAAYIDDGKEDEQRLFLRAVRFLVVLVFLYSGLQKLAHGYYFQGQFLAYSLWRDSFATFFRQILPQEEFMRLTSYVGNVGDGPYLVSSPLFLAVSNFVWVGEIAMGTLLLWRRTRGVALGAAVAFMVGTEIVAREFMFGSLFVAAILLFSSTELNRAWLKFCLALFGVLWLIRLGLLPMMDFS